MNKKGFTLIELLAVIVILAIILLIAVPVVFKTIDKAERSSFESSTRKMSSTAEQRCLEERLEKKAGGFETNFTESGFTGYDIDMKGDNPDGGTVRVNDQCQVEIAVHDSKTCVKKSAASNEFVVTDYEEGNCELVETSSLVDCEFEYVIENDGAPYVAAEGEYTEPTPEEKEFLNLVLTRAEENSVTGRYFELDDYDLGDDIGKFTLQYKGNMRNLDDTAFTENIEFYFTNTKYPALDEESALFVYFHEEIDELLNMEQNRTLIGIDFDGIKIKDILALITIDKNSKTTEFSVLRDINNEYICRAMVDEPMVE